MVVTVDLFGPVPSPEEREATELCYDAMDCPDYEEKKAYAEEALRMWPQCVEAFNILGHYYTNHDNLNQRDLKKALFWCGGWRDYFALYPNLIYIKSLRLIFCRRLPFGQSMLTVSACH